MAPTILGRLRTGKGDSPTTSRTSASPYSTTSPERADSFGRSRSSSSELASRANGTPQLLINDSSMPESPVLPDEPASAAVMSSGAILQRIRSAGTTGAGRRRASSVASNDNRGSFGSDAATRPALAEVLSETLPAHTSTSLGGFTANVAADAHGPQGDGSLTLDHLLAPSTDTLHGSATPIASAPELVARAAAPPMQRRESNQSASGSVNGTASRSSSPTEATLVEPSSSSLAVAGLPSTTRPRSPSRTTVGAPASSPRKNSSDIEGRGRAPSMMGGQKRRAASGGIAGALALSAATLASPLATTGGPVRRASNSRTPTTPNGLGEDVSLSDAGLAVPNGEDNYALDSPPNTASSAHDLGRMTSLDVLGVSNLVLGDEITGYAVAPKKRRDDFHALFRQVPEDDYLIEDYGCALQKEILVQGRIYVSEHHLCFSANIFGWVTSLVIPFAEVVTIEKRMTAYVIPNAISVATLHQRHTFASFLSRDTTFDLITSIWRIKHPDVPTALGQGGAASDNSDDDADEPVTPSGNRRKRSVRRRNKGPRSGATATSELVEPSENGIGRRSPSLGGKNVGPQPSVHPPTECACSKKGEHAKEVCMDATFPCTPEKTYNLMYTSGLLRTFLIQNQQLLEVQMSDWAPNASGLLTRSISYIKPLKNSLGPKQTKCLISDECAHVDYDDAITVLTTTRTPDVPSGGSFSIKTRACITWARGNGSRVVVTTSVDWTARSMLKGVITSASIDGQKAYHTDLEKAMRAYIQQHRSEFIDPAVDEASAGTASGEPAEATDEPAASEPTSPAPAPPTGIMAHFQPVLDILVPLLKDVGSVFSSASTTQLAVGALIVGLLLSNAWTLRTSRAQPDSVRHRAPPAVDSRSPDEVVLAVKGALAEYFNASPARASSPRSDAKREASEVREVLDALEDRIRRLRAVMADVD